MTTEDAPEGKIPQSVSARGITDRATGIERARASRQWLQDAALQALRGTDRMVGGHLLVMGLASRAAGLHDGAVHALESDNPFATYTLLRAYAENAATVLYATGNPHQLDRILGIGNSHPIKVGKITNYAERSDRFGTFQRVYDQLSEFAHPMSRSIFASMNLEGDNDFRWALDPAFKYDSDFLGACALVVELAEANAHLLVDYADAQGW